MKSLLTVTLIMLCLSIQAQEKKITIDQNAEYVNSNFVGFSISRHFNEKFSLQSGLFLTGKGGKFNEDVDLEDDEETFVSVKSIARKTTSQHTATRSLLNKNIASVRSISKLTSETPDSGNSDFITSSNTVHRIH